MGVLQITQFLDPLIGEIVIGEVELFETTLEQYGLQRWIRMTGNIVVSEVEVEQG